MLAKALRSSARPAFVRPFSLRWATDDGANPKVRATTILSVRKGDEVVMIGDGQVSMGSTVVKPNATKVRRLQEGIIAGYAGGTADALTLMELLETKLEEYPGQLLRASVEVAKMWRTDKYLRRLEATMLVCDKDISLTLTGNGDVLEPPHGVVAIGSGGHFALAAARALVDVPDLTAKEIAVRSMDIASDMCVYTNSNYVIESISGEDEGEGEGEDKDADTDADAASEDKA